MQPEQPRWEPRLRPAPDWLVDAADLLAEPDPGPTQWLVDGVVVDRSLAAFVGRWKTMKTYATIDLAVSIVSGRPFLGRYAIPEPGPVLYVIEESGRAALWRRLDALCRGRATRREDVRGLHFATNERVKLDDPEWIERITDAADRTRPRLIVFDPLARMKSSSRDENAQREMAQVIENLRAIRDHADSTVAFIHHTGHQGDQMRGSSDLESVWETRLTWKRDGQATTVEIAAEHREAEASDPISFRAHWDGDTRTMRLQADQPEALPTLADRILEHLAEHGESRADDIAKTLQIRRAWVVRDLEILKETGRATSGPSGRRDKAGRPIRDKVWNVTAQQGLWPVPNPGQPTTSHDPGNRGSVARPPSLEGTPPDEPPNEPHHHENGRAPSSPESATLPKDAIRQDAAREPEGGLVA